jgi:hypothetical protein
MALLDFFRRRPPIRDAGELADFIDRNAAFLVQKGIYEYSRARAGHYSKVLFGEAGFRAAVEASRWRAYPLGLAMVGEIVEGVLTSSDKGGRLERLEALIALTLSVFDRYAVPPDVGQDAWLALRADVSRHLQSLSLHPPKRAMDVPVPFAKSYFDVMPINEKLRGSDFPTITNYLRVTLCNIHDELTKRLDRAALPDLLRVPAT